MPKTMVQAHEMECDLSPAMAAIQLALIRVLDAMLKQVQRNNKLDSSELSLANAFSRSFEATVKQQLNPIWNTISHSTRLAIKDLRTVQDLLQCLLCFNCVSFLRYIQCLRTAAGATTEWLLHSAANTLFQVCLLTVCYSRLPTLPLPL
jgi:DNA excision repair protein ERCC-4